MTTFVQAPLVLASYVACDAKPRDDPCTLFLLVTSATPASFVCL